MRVRLSILHSDIPGFRLGNSVGPLLAKSSHSSEGQPNNLTPACPQLSLIDVGTEALLPSDCEVGSADRNSQQGNRGLGHTGGQGTSPAPQPALHLLLSGLAYQSGARASEP